FEDLRVLDPNGGEVVNVEKTPVVDFLARHLPVRQAMAALAEHGVEAIEAPAVSGRAIEDLEVLLDEGGDDWRCRRQRRQPALDHLLFAAALEHLGAVSLGALRQMLDGGEDGLQLDQLAALGSQLLFQLLESVLDDGVVLPGSDGELAVVVANEKRSFVE